MKRKVDHSAPAREAADRRSGTAKAKSSRMCLEMMNPRGAVERPPAVAPSMHVEDPVGKRIGIYWNGKAGAADFFDAIEGLLKKRLPTASIVRFKGPLDPGDAVAADMARQADTDMYGIGD